MDITMLELLRRNWGWVVLRGVAAAAIFGVLLIWLGFRLKQQVGRAVWA